MEFEILDDPEAPPGALEALRRFLLGPRRQVQAWSDRAPKFAAHAVFALVAVECALAQRLLSGQGRGPSFLAQVFAAAFVIFVAELVVASAASAVAAIFKKTGSRTLTVTYLHFGLSPLLLYLPAVMLCQVAGFPEIVRLLILVVVCLRVGSLWRDIIEVTFKLSPMQSVLVFYASSIVAVGTLFLIGYVAIIGRIASVLG